MPDNLTDDDLALLYLADEMPSADREAFAARLASDPALRRRADTLSRTHDRVFAALDAADLAMPASSGRGTTFVLAAAVRERAVAAPARPHRRPWWLGAWTLYPAATAAVLAVGFYAWWASIPAEDAPKTYDDGPVMAFRADPNADVLALDDDYLARNFDSITLEYENDRELRRILGRLDYLEWKLEQR